MGRKSTGIVERIEAEVLNRLDSGAFPQDHAMPGTHRLADEFGCSYVTMIHVLKRLEEAHRVTRRRGAGTFPARRKKRIAYFAWPQHAVGLHKHIPEIYNRVAHEELAAHGCEVTDFSYELLVTRFFWSRLLENFDGILCSSAYMDRSSQNMVFDSNLPLVFFGPMKTAHHANFVIANWQSGLQEVFARISHPENKTFWIWDCPYKGDITNVASEILLAASAWDIPRQNLILRTLKCDKDAETECCSLEACRQLNAPTDVIHFCSSDFLAFGVYNFFMERGYHAGDFELISCDDLESRGVCPYPVPQLTSINHPKEELARRAVKLLMDLINNTDRTLYTIEIPTTLTLRQSGLR